MKNTVKLTIEFEYEDGQFSDAELDEMLDKVYQLLPDNIRANVEVEGEKSE